MRWRALAVAAAVLAVSLAACDFDEAWTAYCNRPGRCADASWAGTALELAQGSSLRQPVVVDGVHLGRLAQAQSIPAGIQFDVVDAGFGQLVLAVTAPHGAPTGEVRLRLVFEPGDPRFDLVLPNPVVLVTPIVVAQNGGRDGDGGEGTYSRPFATLGWALQRADAGDRILLLPGTYPSLSGGIDLMPGVSVEGESPDGSVVIAGTGAPGSYGFFLYEPNQALSNLVLRNFDVGILVRPSSPITSGRIALTGVSIDACGTGLVANPGAALSLRDVGVSIGGSQDSGMLLNAADVQYRGGLVTSLGGPGIFMYGSGGSLLLEGVTVKTNSFTAEPVLGAALSIACDGGMVRVDGGEIQGNAGAGIAISGSGNTLEMDGGMLSAPLGTGLVLKAGSGASLYLRQTTIQNSQLGLLAEDFRALNGGDGNGSWGGNTFNNGTRPELHDNRPAGGGHPRMTFGRTRFRGVNPSPGVVLDAGTNNSPYGIVIDNPGNEIEFF